MRELFFRSLSPGSQLIFLLFFCFASLLLFSLAGNILVYQLYGFSGFEEEMLQNPSEYPYFISAYRVLLACQHIGSFILPALLFNQMFSFSGEKSFIPREHLLRPGRVVLVLLLMLVSFPLINYLVEINSKLDLPAEMDGLEQRIRAMEDEAQLITERLIGTTGLRDLFANILVVGLLPAIGEEFIFRGILQKILSRMFRNVHVGIWLAAIIFSILHFQFYGFLPRLLLGVLFGYVLIWTGNIWYAVLAHFLNNAGSVVIYYFITRDQLHEQTADLGSSPADAGILISALLAFITVVFLLAKGSVFSSFRQTYLHHPRFVFPEKGEE